VSTAADISHCCFLSSAASILRLGICCTELRAGCHHIPNWQVQHWWLIKRGGYRNPFCAPLMLIHPLLQCP